MRFLQLAMLSKHLAEIKIHDRPRRGWIYTLRTALHMTTRQLAAKIGIKQQTLSRMEAREIEDSLTLKTLRRVAEALGCRLVYAFVPRNGTLEDWVRQQAYQKAAETFHSVDHSMAIEGQRVDDEQESLKQLADDLLKQLDSSMWEQ